MDILVVEDEKHTREFINKGLKEAGHTVETADNGEDGLDKALSENFTAIIVDRMLPGLDGLTLIERLRAENVSTPVLILSAMSDVDHRIEGLESGSDDYLTKPFSFAELLARIEAIVRRVDRKQADSLLTVGDLSMNLHKQEVTMRGEKIILTRIEFRILEVLMRFNGKVVTRTMLLEKVWGYNFLPQTNIVDTHISRLRSKIDLPYQCQLIHTIRGSGYRLSPPDESK